MSNHQQIAARRRPHARSAWRRATKARTIARSSARARKETRRGWRNDLFRNVDPWVRYIDWRPDRNAEQKMLDTFKPINKK